jgi:SAM-dependent methyltransferase
MLKRQGGLFVTAPLPVNVPGYWEEIYQAGRAGWDLGKPTAIFQRLLASGELAPGRLLVVGAGRGHDAREFARHGFEVTAVDFASEAVQAMAAMAEAEAPVEVVQADIFDLPADWAGRFDTLLEYTCFCAIDPARRGEYVDVAARVLRPGGTYAGLFFPLDGSAGGPPFAVTEAEVLGLFGLRGFRLVRSERPEDSVTQRRGMEELMIFRAPGIQSIDEDH